MTPTDQAIARTHSIAHQMGARFSAPAERVEVECDMSTKRYARTMEEAFGPYHRSAASWVVVEDTDPITASDWVMYLLAALVILACVAGALKENFA